MDFKRIVVVTVIFFIIFAAQGIYSNGWSSSWLLNTFAWSFGIAILGIIVRFIIQAVGTKK